MKRVERLASSYVTTIVLLIIYAFGLAIATFIEKYHGTVAAKTIVYYSPLFFLLQFLLVVNFIAALLKYRLLKRKKWGFLLVHFSFVVILLGAMISHLFGEEGVLHLREGHSSNQIEVQTSKGTHYHTLPFSVELQKFTLTRYPGSSSPSSYESKVLVHVDGNTQEALIYMNNVLDVKGYRFFQASYDKDEKGTILSVNKDVAGRNVTYTGYFFLTLGLVLCLVGRNSRFRQLSRRLTEVRKTAAIALLMLFAAAFQLSARPEMSMADAVQKFPVDAAHAARFGALPMQSYSGRMMPVNTFSSEVLRKLHKSETLGKLNSDQFLLSLLSMPDMWMQVPFITLPNKELAYFYDLSEGECSYLEAFDSNGNYKLQQKLEEAYSKMPAQRNKFDKDLMKLDEQINILYQLFHHQMLNLFPKEDDPNHKWYASGDDLTAFAGQDSMFVSRVMDWYLMEVQAALKEGNWEKADEVLDMISTYQQAKNKSLDINPKKIEAELNYNKWHIFNNCKKYYLMLGGILLIFSFILLFKKSGWMGYVKWLLTIAVVFVFLVHTSGMGLRWYIAGYAPWSNSYETMVYVSWATVLGGLLFIRRSPITFALATLFGGIILFVSGMNWMNPQISPLVPVLKSPWLMFHVAVIVAAYGFFGISFLLGISNLIFSSTQYAARSKEETARSAFSVLRVPIIKELSIVNEMSLLIGLALMTVGTFLGAVWANESWGRYWGWDPKETWALITMIVYAIVIHLRLVKKWDNPWLFNLASVIAFASVLMTYFGVNYLLSGMHSYG
ncbi:cytochrome c-type biogenesis protein CcsB [Parabacteroides sp. PF5-5]|uniref:c-type cytochrome biogenesis protein CcsB n=1 Tax=unclassified Parabacteroides TaxID=2649774 RepID=UPI002473D556|nr:MULTISPECIES: c-type cytochrome biogenesis protein CcsB [unclassified Parabacteroides]MDH6303853.1 cytochrome c-type biogenesis protein CcsB [Parabacteroides sp. PH5-39]MDH6314470.1 cytochrome c-type biogenesis protein CcsB [Parabacteroides sp. PF5-13]MDH6318465.1 cytochrome c-type biogenesis protein CcsB [Parabacteroides sp. PH5-13]MDH6322242.1 cytochrome c-type biogenesis protein CcsB [Parabacteroides sp. PH5-8]MDH6325678.1 cytochrome c-type biogenesis protein CcsB [Parabacteroides sp. PH